MNISKVVLAGCLACLSLTFASAQPVGSSQQDKALELLRQRIADERANPSVPSEPEASARPVEEPSDAGSVAPTVKQPEDPAAFQNALNLLRDSIAKERQASQAAPVKATAPVSVEAPRSVPARVPPASPDPKVMRAVRDAIAAQRQAAKPAPTPASVEASSSAPAEKSVESTLAAQAPQAISPAPKPASIPAHAPTVEPQPSGPKTKQQRLMELLQLYRADKVTPHEYHDKRAKIISEP